MPYTLFLVLHSFQKAKISKQSNWCPRTNKSALVKVWQSQLGFSDVFNAQSTYFYCKRAILFLSSFNILTPHPPLRSPPLLRGEDRLAGRRGGWGSIFWKTREIGLPSYSKICTLWFNVMYNAGVYDRLSGRPDEQGENEGDVQRCCPLCKLYKKKKLFAIPNMVFSYFETRWWRGSCFLLSS